MHVNTNACSLTLVSSDSSVWSHGFGRARLFKWKLQNRHLCLVDIVSADTSVQSFEPKQGNTTYRLTSSKATQGFLHDNFQFVHFGQRYLRFLAELYHNPVTGGPRIGGFHTSMRDTVVREFIRYNAARLLHREVCLDREPCGWKALKNADEFYLNAIDIAYQRAWAIHSKFYDQNLDIGVNPNPDFFRTPNKPPNDKFIDETILLVDEEDPDAVDMTGFDQSHYCKYLPW